MKVLYDYQMFTTQNAGGITRYFYELITHFDKDDAVSWEIPIKYSDNLYLREHPFFSNKLLPNPSQLKNYKGFSKVSFAADKVLYKLKSKLDKSHHWGMEYEVNKKASIEKIKVGNFDIFHPTYFDNYFMDFIGDKPFVLTVYDMINQIFPEISLHHPIDKTQKMIDRADRIIAISESTKKDLINIFNVDERKIDVTYLANSLKGNLQVVEDAFKAQIPPEYLLYVGGRWDYKNFLFFAQMMATILKTEPDLKVVCTGAPFNASELYLFNKLGIRQAFQTVFVSDAELAYLYTNAVAFVFPSLYEGFGLPVLEAFSCGCPAVISNTASLPEVGGDAAIYFEPKNPASMLDALKSVLTNPVLREEKIAKGYEQLKKFSLEKTAIQTRQVYEKIFTC